MAVGGHTSEKTALCYQRAIMEAQAEEIREQILGRTADSD
jgi:hypothetical protein